MSKRSHQRRRMRYRYAHTWYVVTRRWIGAPVGTWDTDIYDPTNQPPRLIAANELWEPITQP